LLSCERSAWEPTSFAPGGVLDRTEVPHVTFVPVCVIIISTQLLLFLSFSSFGPPSFEALDQLDESRRALRRLDETMTKQLLGCWSIRRVSL
jgi:hypothetical protein